MEFKTKRSGKLTVRYVTGMFESIFEKKIQTEK